MHVAPRLSARWGTAAASLLLLGASFPESASLSDGPLSAGSYRWADQGSIEGPVYIIVSLERQRVHVYDGDRLIGVARISSGKKGHRTPLGQFSILQKRQWHRSNLYSNAPMPYMQRLTWDGIALHAGHDPGYPASHGCVRLPTAFARQLFALTRLGTPVSVTQDRLSASVRFDPLVLEDGDSALFSISPGDRARPGHQGLPASGPRLEIDPSVFGGGFTRS